MNYTIAPYKHELIARKKIKMTDQLHIESGFCVIEILPTHVLIYDCVISASMVSF